MVRKAEQRAQAPMGKEPGNNHSAVPLLDGHHRWCQRNSSSAMSTFLA